MHLNGNHRAILQRIARTAMADHGLLTDFPPPALAELEAIKARAGVAAGARDLRDLLWASIDNNHSPDLDQITVAEAMPDGAARILVALADVDSLVKKGTALDEHARWNTTSVYTAAEVFPMLPEDLSTGLTSLNCGEDRMAVVVDIRVDAGGSLLGSDLYMARVRNHAKLAYPGVAAWLEGGAAPEALSAVPGLEANLRLQDRVAQKLKGLRHLHGALTLHSAEATPVFDGDRIRDLAAEEKDRAKALIEDFMIAANGVSARYLTAGNYPSLRRVVRTPKRWDRIVAVAGEHGTRLPEAPDPVALEAFLGQAEAADPLRFPDLSLTIVKLLGKGEYVAEQPGAAAPGHFGLAVKDYAHATAPNRRFADLVTQRMLKAAMEAGPCPYTMEELGQLAARCTREEDAAGKVERQVGKSAAALFLEDRIGQRFDAIVTGAAAKGTWVRIFSPPTEGRLLEGTAGLEVGRRVQVQLTAVDVERGFIDFRRV
jgi:exoribonuclease-2